MPAAAPVATFPIVILAVVSTGTEPPPSTGTFTVGEVCWATGLNRLQVAPSRIRDGSKALVVKLTTGALRMGNPGRAIWISMVARRELANRCPQKNATERNLEIGSSVTLAGQEAAGEGKASAVKLGSAKLSPAIRRPASCWFKAI